MIYMFRIIHYYLQENFRNKGIETNKLDPAYFLSGPGLTWQAYLKKTEVELQFTYRS